MFSVVVPLYNKQDFIGRAIESVLGQSVADFELIIVDDGSTDHSVERVLSYGDPRIQLVQQANAGPGAARNAGMRRCSRPWIAFLDGDDFWFGDHLAEFAKMAQGFPEAGLLGTSYLEGEDWSTAQPAQRDARVREVDYFRLAAHHIAVICSSTVAVRRSVALKVGDFGEYPTGEDLEYWARMAIRAPTVLSDRITAYYYRNDDSVMARTEREGAGDSAPKTVFQIWPSVQYLEGIKELPEHSQRRTSIDRYQRNAAYLSLFNYLVRGQIENARHIAYALPGRGPDKATLLAWLLRLPKPLLRLGMCALRARRSSPLRG